jgi:hypothetical protein
LLVDTSERNVSHVTRRLRHLVTVASGVDITVAWQQFCRPLSEYIEVSLEAFKELVKLHQDVELVGESLVAAGAVPLIARVEFGTAERQMYEALLAAEAPLSFDAIRGQLLDRTQFRVQALLSKSVVVVERSNHYSALLRTQRNLVDDDGHLSPDVEEDDPSVEIMTSVETLEDLNDVAPVVSILSEREHGRTETNVWPLSRLLDMVETNRLVLPEIQRSYVWKSTQVRELIDSLYRGFPIGTMLIWTTEEELRARAVGQASRNPGVPINSATFYLLDGQQRVTSLSRVARGEFDVLFNPLSEEFATANSVSLRSRFNVRVSDVWAAPDAAWSQLSDAIPEVDQQLAKSRLIRLSAVLDRHVAVDLLHDFSYEEVTSIFVRVNQKGTRLKAAELALAQIAQRLPNMISDDVGAYVSRLQGRGWQFDDQFLLRCLTAVARDRSAFKHLASMSRPEVMDAWERLVPAMDQWLDMLETRLGIESMEFLVSMNSHVVPIAWLASAPASLHETSLLEWFVHAQVWTRYTGATETAMDVDLRRLQLGKSGNPFPTLLQLLRGTGQSARIAQADLQNARRQSPLRLLSFLAARRNGAIDLETGSPITSTNQATGDLNVYQIFSPAAMKRVVAARELAELTNYLVGSNPTLMLKSPFESLRQLEDDERLALGVPADTELLQPLRYRDFIRERRRLLAAQMNDVIKSLSPKSLSQVSATLVSPGAVSGTDRESESNPGGYRLSQH